MLRISFVIFTLSFLLSARAQNCSLYPNTQSVLVEYGVKKITQYVMPYGKAKEINAVYFLDSAGCAYRWLQRRTYNNNNEYYITEEKGSWQSGKRERYYAKLDADSNEVLIERRVEFYDKSGRKRKDEIWTMVDGKLQKTTNFFGSAEPDTIDRQSFITNAHHDTLQKIFSKSDKYNNFYLHLRYENGKWTEEQKSEIIRNADDGTEIHKRWVKGKLVEGRRLETKKVNEDLSVTTVFDLEGNPIEKTEFNSRGDYSVYAYENGKWVFKYEELMPIADPVENNSEGRMPELLVDEKQGKKSLTKQSKKKAKEKEIVIKKKEIKRPGKGKPVEKLYYADPVKKDQIIMRERYTPEGLILETDLIRDSKKWIYEYEFF